MGRGVTLLTLVLLLSAALNGLCAVLHISFGTESFPCPMVYLTFWGTTNSVAAEPERATTHGPRLKSQGRDKAILPVPRALLTTFCNSSLSHRPHSTRFSGLKTALSDVEKFAHLCSHRLVCSNTHLFMIVFTNFIQYLFASFRLPNLNDVW